VPAATDDYASLFASPAGPCRRAAAVTPSDSADLANVSRALYVGVSGDVVVITQGGDTVTFKAAPVGVLPIAVSRVKSTGTAATNILALW
jgi:hypothetical protein